MIKHTVDKLMTQIKNLKSYHSSASSQALKALESDGSLEIIKVDDEKVEAQTQTKVTNFETKTTMTNDLPGKLFESVGLQCSLIEDEKPWMMLSQSLISHLNRLSSVFSLFVRFFRDQLFV